MARNGQNKKSKLTAIPSAASFIAVLECSWRIMSAITLKTVVFLGSARNVVPPWGGCARLGDRVLKVGSKSYLIVSHPTLVQEPPGRAPETY